LVSGGGSKKGIMSERNVGWSKIKRKKGYHWSIRLPDLVERKKAVSTMVRGNQKKGCGRKQVVGNELFPRGVRERRPTGSIRQAKRREQTS